MSLCVCVCVCVSDLGLRHDIEVVVVRREGHVSEDGSILHCLHRLILQSTRGTIYPDLEKHGSTLRINIFNICMIFQITVTHTLPFRYRKNINIKKKPHMKYISSLAVLGILLILSFRFLKSVPAL